MKIIVFDYTVFIGVICVLEYFTYSVLLEVYLDKNKDSHSFRIAFKE